MISFACRHCASKLKVKDDFGGKKVRCPKCQKPVEVPAPVESATLPPQPCGSVHEDVTLPPQAGAGAVHETGPTNGSAALAPDSASELDQEPTESLAATSHFEVQQEIARGGMGAIMRAVDQDICREVAVKFLLNSADAKQKTRFVEEAQITGQLEHPNIVPIHQLGAHPDGRCFFSMKMVKGRSLAQLLKEPPPGYTLGRFLTIFVSICNAMAYAHSRNVIHRDLKPANVMVGDFGEVYVMDWGLAKVLGSDEPEKEPEEAPATLRQRRSDTQAPAPAKTTDSSANVKIATVRSADEHLTQAGSIMGTPAYMPPEQAQGEDVDTRADIYSLGAILYEIMTLTPPPGRSGDIVVLITRVVEGQIDPPEQRAPDRVKEGWIPPELSAVAMKALALKKRHRYQTVEELQRDIQRYQEGRSVSAKHDSIWEQLVKFVKRNKGFSFATATALLILTVVVSISLKVNYDARVRAELAFESDLRAQQEKENAIKIALPALIRSARQLAGDGNVEQALTQVEVALLYDAQNADAHLLKGQLLMAQQRWADGRAELAQYLQIRPHDPVAVKLQRLSVRAEADEPGVWFDYANYLQQQKLAMPATEFLQRAQKSAKSREPLMAAYRTQIDSQWPGASLELKLLTNGQLRFGINSGNRPTMQATNLDYLKGIPLDRLMQWHCKKLKDISALRGMPLQYLELDGCPEIPDLEPLRGLRLKKLYLTRCLRIKDLEPLRGLPLTELTMNDVPISDLSPLKGMPLDALEIHINSFVKDIEPLRDMPLTHLKLSLLEELSSLEPLRGMPLVHLDLLRSSKITDLSPLEGMKLTYLNLERLTLESAEPLRGMPLDSLLITGFRDVTPLEGMKLKKVTLNTKSLPKGIEVLRRMDSLQAIRPSGIRNLEYTPQEFWRRYDAGEFGKAK